jgi:hypothetical protein
MSNRTKVAAEVGTTSVAPISRGETNETVNSVMASQGQVTAVVHPDRIDLVNTNGLEASDVQLLARLQSEMFTSDSRTFDEVAASIRNDMGAAEHITREMGALVVRRYVPAGLKLNAVAAVMTEKGFNKWLKAGVAHNERELEFVRQARQIAGMGHEILAYADLGKNRLRELNYMLREMPEYEDHKLTPEIIREALRKLERQYPFPITAEMSDEDIKAFRAWMDGIITKFRLDRALAGTWEVPFNLCEQIGSARGLALEKQHAEKVAGWLQTKTDKVTALTKWIDEGIPRDEREVTPPDPKRLIENLTKITGWAENVVKDAALVAECRTTTDASIILTKAISAIQALQAKFVTVEG